MEKSSPVTAGPDGLFDIMDPAIDLEAVARRLESNLELHQRLFAGAPAMANLDFEGRRIDSNSALHYHLSDAERECDQVGTEKELAPSWAAQLPVIGRWWGRIRGELHGLILFYVNRAAGRQAGINKDVVSALRHVANQAEEIEQLKGQIEALEERLLALEGRD